MKFQLSAITPIVASLGLCACGDGGELGSVKKVEQISDALFSGSCYLLVQQSTGRFLDAYTDGNGQVVTRTFQNNDTQRWCFTLLSGSEFGTGVFTIQHRNFQGQFLDAFESAGNDYRMVLRDAQTDTTQYWIVGEFGGQVRQLSSGRYADAYNSVSTDFQAVTRTAQGDGSQTWNAIAF